MVQASSTAYKRTWYYFRNIIYESDEGLLLPEIKNRTLNTFAGTRDATDLRTSATVPGTFSVASFYNYPLKQNFKRTYYKGQNMIADSGGIIKGLILIAKFLYFFSSTNLYNQELLNFNLPNYSKSNNCNKKVTVPKKIRREVSIVEDRSNKKSHTAEKTTTSQLLVLNNNKETFKLKRPNDINYTLCETLFPPICFKSRKHIKYASGLRSVIKRQLDIREILNKVNLIDKMSILLMGQDYQVMNLCPNRMISLKKDFTEDEKILKTQKEIKIMDVKFDLKRNFDEMIVK
jgi:hypothetical protein